MNNLLILLVQTKSEATIEIISLLLVAGIVGYVTAWLYNKSIYEKKIRAVESDKHELNNRIVNLDTNIFNLKKSLGEKDIEIEQLTMEGKALVHIAQRKHILNYESFGTATEAEKDDLKMISGIGPVNEISLNALDIYTFRQISKFTAQDIDAINNTIIYFSGRIERDEWVEQAKDLVRSQDKIIELFKRISERKSNIQYNRIGIAHKDEADDLTIISGIGGWIKEKLNVLDIYTFRQISNFTKEDIYAVTEAIEYFPGRIERDEWVYQAQELVRIAGNKSELLKRIRDRQGRIYFDRLGIAHKHEANNLTLIDGLGLWVEERLNLLGIYTFDQIGKLTHQDVETITEVLEIIPGRVEQDNWVRQARELAKKTVKSGIGITRNLDLISE
jgi:predicted flap endonuclease-1-like 5' DNA nuclease